MERARTGAGVAGRIFNFLSQFDRATLRRCWDNDNPFTGAAGNFGASGRFPRHRTDRSRCHRVAPGNWFVICNFSENANRQGLWYPRQKRVHPWMAKGVMGEGCAPEVKSHSSRRSLSVCVLTIKTARRSSSAKTVQSIVWVGRSVRRELSQEIGATLQRVRMNFNHKNSWCRLVFISIEAATATSPLFLPHIIRYYSKCPPSFQFSFCVSKHRYTK